MADQEEQISEQLTQSFANTLNRHGYGFQFSVLKKVDELVKQRRFHWRLEACEFPVDVQGIGTRIDFVLSRPPNRDNSSPLYLIGECKRANPALSNWCFVRAPYTHSAASEEFDQDRMIMECLFRDEGGLRTFARALFSSENIYHLGIEVRSNLKGDQAGEAGQAIEKAATQVSRSLNGFIQTMVKEPQIVDEDLKQFRQIDFLPAIFTTANLYVSSIDLSLADIQTGKITLKSEDVKPVRWLFYQYPLSPGLKHFVEAKQRGYSLATLLQWGYLRTIPIVSPLGTEDFLLWASKLCTAGSW